MVAGAAFIPNTASILVLRRRAARAGKEGDSEEIIPRHIKKRGR
jgi:hypothetical protein